MTIAGDVESRRRFHFPGPSQPTSCDRKHQAIELADHTQNCDGDCIDSIADCSGGDGTDPCRDVLFDRGRAHQNQIRLDGINLQLTSTHPDTRRYRALQKETCGLENYFAYINRGW